MGTRAGVSFLCASLSEIPLMEPLDSEAFCHSFKRHGYVSPAPAGREDSTACSSPVEMPLILSPALLPMRVCAFLQGKKFCQQAQVHRCEPYSRRSCSYMLITYAAPCLPAARWPMPPCEQSPPQSSVFSGTWFATLMPVFLGCSGALPADYFRRSEQRPCCRREMSHRSTSDPWTLQYRTWRPGLCSFNRHLIKTTCNRKAQEEVAWALPVLHRSSSRSLV